MKDSKKEIISDLKNKLTEFKSKFKEKKIENTANDDITNMEINMNTLKNYYKSQKKENKDNININKLNKLNQIYQNNDKFLNLSNTNNNNIDKNENINKDIDNINYNNYIKENGKKEIVKQNSNSKSSANIIQNKNYLDFDIDKIINQSKKPKKEKSEYNFINPPTELNTTKYKTFVNLDEFKFEQNKKQSDLMNYNRNLSNKNFIKLNLSLKKGSNVSNNSITDRNHRIINSYNTDNLYKQNFSEPNTIKNKKNKNYYKLKSKLTDFMNEIKLSNENKKMSKIRHSLIKPAIKEDNSKYNLNFLSNNYNNEENFFKKSYNKIYKNNYNLKDIFNNNITYNNKNEQIRYSSQSKNIPLYQKSNIRNSNFEKNSIVSNLNNKSLSNFNYNTNKNSFNNMILNDIHSLKYTIQNLSNEDINNLPFSVYKEIEELYYLIYLKFFKNN